MELAEATCKLPDWLDWRSWTRLEADDKRYEEFRGVLRDIYNPDSPYSLFFSNMAPELTDSVNCLVGRDRKYIYLYDWRPEKFVLRETDRGGYVYRSEICQSHWQAALFELPVSEEHPLYALPIKINKDSCHSKDARVLYDILEDADNITAIYIVHSSRIAHPRLVFPDYGHTVALDMDALAALGVKKFTAPFR